MICLPRFECCVDGDHKKPNDTRTGPAGGALGGLALEPPLAAQVLGSAGVNLHSGIGSLAYGDRL
jgi:hypothetical protein